MDEKIGFGLYQTCRNVLDTCLCFCYGGVGGVGEEWIGGLDQDMEGWDGVMSV